VHLVGFIIRIQEVILPQQHNLLFQLYRSILQILASVGYLEQYIRIYNNASISLLFGLNIQ